MKFLFTNFDSVWQLFLQHLSMTVIALGIALLIAIPLGILVSKFQRLYFPVTGFFGILYTIPSLALFAFLIPVTGLDVQTAIVGLVAYSQMILIRNVVAAIKGIDPLMLEAAKGMGMNRGQVLMKIEIPLAVPVIIAGIRVAAVSTISIGSVAAWIGAGGLGTLIFDGLYRSYPDKIIAGTVSIAVLAILADLLFRGIEWMFRPKMA
ncbi:ABC transporter permease [Neobacillus cucumis]|uniref:ABC transporter permease n=1 Tax=Neobacillus cucumis TaxID=1740721 RepID=UPI001962E3E0|nr:ABC transporter permease [Neobacillus cucumis]MBM7650744.1 osmoprotectant transport system permease protein [Neobacillus cucumis]